MDLVAQEKADYKNGDHGWKLLIKNRKATGFLFACSEKRLVLSVTREKPNETKLIDLCF